MIENNVISWPPCWVAVEVNAAPTLPISAPFAHNPPVGPGNPPSARDAPVARAGADDDRVVLEEFLGLAIGAADRACSGSLRATSSGTSSGRV